nr:proline-rich protein HaeIII subfamily 1-like [Procambarus clarkii]
MYAQAAETNLTQTQSKSPRVEGSRDQLNRETTKVAPGGRQPRPTQQRNHQSGPGWKAAETNSTEKQPKWPRVEGSRDQLNRETTKVAPGGRQPKPTQHRNNQSLPGWKAAETNSTEKPPKSPRVEGSRDQLNRETTKVAPGGRQPRPTQQRNNQSGPGWKAAETNSTEKPPKSPRVEGSRDQLNRETTKVAPGGRQPRPTQQRNHQSGPGWKAAETNSTEKPPKSPRVEGSRDQLNRETTKVAPGGRQDTTTRISGLSQHWHLFKTRCNITV